MPKNSIMPKRFNGYDKSPEDFQKKILVVCPKCSKKAQEINLGHEVGKEKIKLTCTHCGFNYTSCSSHPDFQLWLRKELPEGIVFAYNYEHLEYIEKHVSAKLRERDLVDIKNKSIGSRLPRWMTSKKNRNYVLNVIKQLKEKV